MNISGFVRDHHGSDRRMTGGTNWHLGFNISPKFFPTMIASLR
jgi:hypothetical protein